MAAEKWAAVRQQKDEAIKQEIIKIGAKDSEAKRLERYEQRILKRLRQTHVKQQEAIEEIQTIFAAGRDIRSSKMNSADWMTENNSSVMQQQHQSLSMSTTQ